MFDYDKAMLTEQQRPSCSREPSSSDAGCLCGRQIEGHADARGTNEYNLALGARRGNAARDYLVSLGIAGDRLSVVSKGEEAPVCTEQNEVCFAQNRRATFVITAK